MKGMTERAVRERMRYVVSFTERYSEFEKFLGFRGREGKERGRKRCEERKERLKNKSENLSVGVVDMNSKIPDPLSFSLCVEFSHRRLFVKSVLLPPPPLPPSHCSNPPPPPVRDAVGCHSRVL